MCSAVIGLPFCVDAGRLDFKMKPKGSDGRERA
jgi:hypothetical protein